jgi:hypothetical protein
MNFTHISGRAGDVVGKHRLDGRHRDFHVTFLVLLARIFLAAAWRRAA